MLRFRTWRHARAFFIAVTLAAFPALPVRAADTEVNIDNFTFTPKELTVKAGTVVVFRNRDDIPHTVNGTKGEFHSKALDTDESFSFTFTEAGSYVYFCGLHPQMQGKIVVSRSNPRDRCNPFCWKSIYPQEVQRHRRVLIYMVGYKSG